VRHSVVAVRCLAASSSTHRGTRPLGPRGTSSGGIGTCRLWPHRAAKGNCNSPIHPGDACPRLLRQASDRGTTRENNSRRDTGSPACRAAWRADEVVVALQPGHDGAHLASGLDDDIEATKDQIDRTDALSLPAIACVYPPHAYCSLLPAASLASACGPVLVTRAQRHVAARRAADHRAGPVNGGWRLRCRASGRAQACPGPVALGRPWSES
jgi:hypothetical protein